MSEVLARHAVRRARVLVAGGPGHWVTRVRVEQAVLHRGWRLAAAPAQADVLAVCGSTGPELSEAVALVWEQLPGPRVRVDIPDQGSVEERLEDAAGRLLQNHPHVDDARRRSAREEQPDRAEGAASGHQGHEGVGHGDMDEQGPGGMDHEEHGGMDHEGHEGMDMAPAGIPLAEGGQDRDGLQMDVLHLRLGPVLRHWPAGLVLRCSLQGDVVVAAEVSQLDGGSTGADPGGPVEDRALLEAARRCDNVTDVLTLAGWQDAAATARRIRDTLLTGSHPQGSLPALDRLHRRVERSRLLRWSLRGLGPLDDGALSRHGLAGIRRGDARDRLLSLLEQARAALAEGPAAQDPADESAVLAALPAVVNGLELAAARLVVATFGLEPLAVARQVARG